jgi:hypothetical protein
MLLTARERGHLHWLCLGMRMPGAVGQHDARDLQRIHASLAHIRACSNQNQPRLRKVGKTILAGTPSACVLNTGAVDRGHQTLTQRTFLTPHGPTVTRWHHSCFHLQGGQRLICPAVQGFNRYHEPSRQYASCWATSRSAARACEAWPGLACSKLARSKPLCSRCMKRGPGAALPAYIPRLYPP